MERELDLIGSIRNEVEEECRILMEESEEKRKKKKEETHRRCLILKRDHERDWKKKKGLAQKKRKKIIEIESGKYHLQKEKEILEALLSRMKKEIELQRDKPYYKEILIDWICEAAIGLDCPKALVNGGKRERKLLNDDSLRQAEKKIKEIRKISVFLSWSSDEALEEQGVVLSDLEGRMIYDNLVKTRISRYEQKITSIIQKEVLQKEISEDELTTNLIDKETGDLVPSNLVSSDFSAESETP